MMIREKHDIAIIGGGPAGLAAAIAAKKAGSGDIVLIERDRVLGGILGQCIHDGFGLHAFGEALSGPEYAARYIEMEEELGICVMENTIALNLSGDKVLRVSRGGEIKEIEASAVILAMGCRERTRGALSIPGDRPAGVYTAGMAQNLVNMENIMPGRHVCILGSGDIGLIMARRMTLEGAKVEAVFEILPYSSGLPRNIRQCLDDYGIPLYLSTTVTDIRGSGRLEEITVMEVDDKRAPIPGTERNIKCDTLLLSVGLIPENELSREAGVPIDNTTQGALVDEACMTGIDGIFACGNVLHVHDLVDFVSEEASRAGASASEYVRGLKTEGKSECDTKVSAGEGVRYVVPQKIGRSGEVKLAFRVSSPSRNGIVEISADGRVIKQETHARLHPAEMVWVSIENESGTKELEVRVR